MSVDMALKDSGAIRKKGKSSRSKDEASSPFCYVDDNGNEYFDKAMAIKFILEKFPNLYTDEFDNLFYFSAAAGWEDEIENEIKNFIQVTDNSLSEHNINEIISGVKHITYNKKFKNNLLPNSFIPLEGGLYNAELHKLEEHNKNYFYKNIKRKYIPGVAEESLTLSKFLDKVLSHPERDKTSIYETLAWALMNDNSIQGMLIFYGDGGNGKGILQNQVIAGMLGHENVAMPDLTRIANYPFELQGLINKKALLFSESIKGVSYNWEILKRITGHDYENIPIKNKPAMQYQYKSAVILSTNNLIPPKDELSVWRRIINIVEFSNYLNDLTADDIAKIVNGLTNPDEFDRLFSFIADQIFPKFISSGFSNRYNINTAKEKYLMKSNPAIPYLYMKESKDEILTDPSDVLEYCRAHNYDQNICYAESRGIAMIFQTKEKLIEQINKFCKANHLPKYDPLDKKSQIKVGQAIHYLGLDVSDYRKMINGKVIHAWAGIFIPPDDGDLKLPGEAGEPRENIQKNNLENQDMSFDTSPDSSTEQPMIEDVESTAGLANSAVQEQNGDHEGKVKTGQPNNIPEEILRKEILNTIMDKAPLTEFKSLTPKGIHDLICIKFPGVNLSDIYRICKEEYDKGTLSKYPSGYRYNGGEY